MYRVFLTPTRSDPVDAHSVAIVGSDGPHPVFQLWAGTAEAGDRRLMAAYPVTKVHHIVRVDDES